MQTYLYIHKENTGIPQAQFRGRYPLRHMDYELGRAVGRRGEIASGIRGGEIRVVIDGFADKAFLRWLFGLSGKEDGEVVTLDEYEQTVAKFRFSGASVKDFRVSYDSRVKASVSTIVTIEAGEIATDRDLHFESR